MYSNKEMNLLLLVITLTVIQICATRHPKSTLGSVNSHRIQDPALHPLKSRPHQSMNKYQTNFYRRIKRQPIRIMHDNRVQEKKKDKEKTKKKKDAKCGKTYRVKENSIFMIKLSSKENCNIIFRAAKKVSFSFKCKKLESSDICKNTNLFIGTGKTAPVRYCGTDNKIIEKTSKLTEMKFILRQSKNKHRVPYKIVCKIKASGGEGYRAIGRQVCPLDCGQTFANAEAESKEKISIPNKETSLSFNGSYTTNDTVVLNAEDIFPLTFGSNDERGEETSSQYVPPVPRTDDLTQVGKDVSTTDSMTYITRLTNSLLYDSTHNHEFVDNSKSPSLDDAFNELIDHLALTKVPAVIIDNEIDHSNLDDNRVIGGKDSTKGEWPWMAYLVLIIENTEYQCGGTLVTMNYVLTAAHCVFDAKLSSNDKIKVKVGHIDHKDKSKLDTIRVQSVILHPDYNTKTQEHDIALLKLQKKIENPKLKPICLAPKGNYANRDSVLLGWGHTNNDEKDKRHTLQEVTVTVVNHDTCKLNYSVINYRFPITENHICNYTPGKDSCVGDSGGPLMMQLGTSWYQIGIISHGRDCAKTGFPGVNTYVPNYSKWIANTIKNKRCTY